MIQNPLIQESLTFGTPFESIPFDTIQPEHYLEAIEYWTSITRSRLEQLLTVSDVSFVSVIEPLEKLTYEIDRIVGAFSSLRLAEDSEALRSIAPEISQKMTELGHLITLNPEVFALVAQVYQADNHHLNTEQHTLLEKTYKGFIRAGAELKGSARERFQEIELALAHQSLEFGNRVLGEQNAFTLELEESQLRGLPQDWIDQSAREAQRRDLKGWVVTLDYPSYVPFMTYATDRDVRQKVYQAFATVGNKDNQYCTREIITKIARLRAERAEILGFAHHAAYVLDNRMAQNLETAQALLEELYQASYSQAQKDLVEVTKLAQDDGIETFAAWDYAYYKEKLKQLTYQIDDEKLKSYFPLSGVIQALFGVAEKLYGLQFDITTEVSVYHPDVLTYVVSEKDGQYVGLLYLDLYSRPGKSAGAWMTEYKAQWKELKKNTLVNHRPHISFVMSLARPVDSKETLLSLREVETAFHEFGHSLHGLLADGQYQSLSGTNVLWDFVELPSQLMENWVTHPEFLAEYARHYETGESLPVEYQRTLRELKSFQEGMTTLRQLRFSALDFAWYTQSSTDDFHLDTIEAGINQRYALLPEVVGSAISTQFSHIFRGGYSAGYYSYKWAEVLEADVFERFMEEGVFSSELGQKFREEILSRGGSEHPAKLYRTFMGKNPDVKALLRRAGFNKT